MARHLRMTFALGLFTCAAGLGAAAAQSTLNRIVGPGEFGRPLVIDGIWGQSVSALSVATGVPMGLERVPRSAPYEKRPGAGVTVTGLTLREALQAITAKDPRYEWREFDDVVVIRPATAWDAPEHPLHAQVEPVRNDDMRARDALAVVAAFLGTSRCEDHPDSKRFSLQFEQGTVLELLIAIVRAHGELTWEFKEPPGSANPNAALPFVITFLVGGSGAGCGVPGTRASDRASPSVSAVERRDSPNAGMPVSSLIDRLVGPQRSGQAVVLTSVSSAQMSQLAAAANVPMGFESADPGPSSSPRGLHFVATGRPLGEALGHLVALDPRYGWREMDGVIVLRPVNAWNDSSHLLFALSGRVRLEDVTTGGAMQRVAALLGAPSGQGSLRGDTKRFSVDAPSGTILDLLNAIVRAHGDSSWEFRPAEAEEPYESGARYVLLLHGFGGLGTGVHIP